VENPTPSNAKGKKAITSDRPGEARSIDFYQLQAYPGAVEDDDDRFVDSCGLAGIQLLMRVEKMPPNSVK
jgi:hypothetical protein